MRKSKLTTDEILAAEKAKDARKQSRSQGFKMMDVRDQGTAVMSNGVRIEWHVPKDRREEYVGYSAVDDGHFVLTIDGKKRVFDGEEFRRWLRWV